MAKRAKSQAGRPDRGRRPERRPSPPSAPPAPAGRRPAPLPPPAQPPAEAVHSFETAMQALQRHQYSQAAELFRSLISQYPTERALLDRSRVYLGICERELARRPAEPATVEERVTSATAALNNGDETGAERLARSVLADDPRHDLALYLMAAIEARRGAIDGALSYLREAIDVSPEASAQARHDPDFEGLRHTDAFRALTEPPPHSPHPRRPRRGRA